jgi:hypothetical protein
MRKSSARATAKNSFSFPIEYEPNNNRGLRKLAHISLASETAEAITLSLLKNLQPKQKKRHPPRLVEGSRI